MWPVVRSIIVMVAGPVSIKITIGSVIVLILIQVVPILIVVVLA